MDLKSSGVGGAWRRMTAHDGFSGDLLHTGVIISISSTSEWPVTSVLGLRREEIRINCGFHRKKTSGTVANSGVHRKRSYTVVLMPRP